jgi:hypothetical protein
MGSMSMQPSQPGGPPDAPAAIMRSVLIMLALCSACSSSPPPLARHPQSSDEHLAAADQHSARAQAQRRGAPGADRDPTHPSRYQCGDVALSDQATSGSERLVQAVPCWDTSEDRGAGAAAREQRLADDERHAAAELIEAERTACRGLRARDLETSPFAHRKQIAEVIPHRQAGTLRGVRIIYKPVLGLTAAWMQQALACHRARFERLGEPATYMPEDPSLVATAKATVVQRGDHVEILVETTDEVSSNVALGRAQDLLGPRTAVTN